MSEKLQTRLTIIAVIVIIIIGIFLKGIPELKKTLGSSDKFITSKNYEELSKRISDIIGEDNNVVIYNNNIFEVQCS